MGPSATTADVVHHRLVHPVQFVQTLDGIASIPDRSDDFGIDLGAWMICSNAPSQINVATLLPHVADVVRLRSKAKVSGVAAQAIVTQVHDDCAVIGITCGYWTVYAFPYSSMGEHFVSFRPRADTPIASGS